MSYLARRRQKVSLTWLGAVKEVRVIAALPQLHQNVQQAHLVRLASTIHYVDIFHQNLGVPADSDVNVIMQDNASKGDNIYNVANCLAAMLVSSLLKTYHTDRQDKLRRLHDSPARTVFQKY